MVTKTRPGADYCSDHELLTAKFRLILKKVGKTTSILRHDLNKILYNYIVEVTNRFKGLDLIEKVPENLWMEVHNIIEEAVIKTIPKKKKCKKGKSKARILKWFAIPFSSGPQSVRPLHCAQPSWVAPHGMA